MRFENLDERSVIRSARAEFDDRRNMYSPEIFLSDNAFDPGFHYLNSPATTDPIGNYFIILIKQNNRELLMRPSLRCRIQGIGREGKSEEEEEVRTYNFLKPFATII